MKTFIQYLNEVATTPHKVGRGNKSGIKKHVYVGKKKYNDTRHETTYHFSHPDGKRHISVKFQGHHDGDGKEPHRTDLSYGVHHERPGKAVSGALASGAMNARMGVSTPKHTGEIHSKVQSIVKHHMKHSKTNEIHWTSEKFPREERNTRSHGRRTRIYQRQVKRNLSDHPDWDYHDDSHESESSDAYTRHALIRKQK